MVRPSVASPRLSPEEITASFAEVEVVCDPEAIERALEPLLDQCLPYYERLRKNKIRVHAAEVR